MASASKLLSGGTVEQRLRRLEEALRFEEVLLAFSACGTEDTTGGAGAGGSIVVRKNSGADVGTRPRLNLIEGTNVTLTVTDDAGGNELDITIAAAGGGGGADHTHYAEAPTGTYPGTGPFGLAHTPFTDQESVFHRGVRCTRVGAAPGLLEYTLSGTNLTLGFTAQASGDLQVIYPASAGAASHTHHLDIPTGTYPGTGPFALTTTPQSGQESVFHRGVRCTRVGSTPGLLEYTLSGVNLTMGFAVQASGDLQVSYPA